MERKYSIYISAFSGKSLQESANILAKTFNLTVENAKKILENVPVLFMNNLTRKEVRTLKGKLISVSKAGVEFTVSAQDLPYLAKVSYHTDMQNARIEGNWYNFAFSCPHCKNLILLKPAVVEGIEQKVVPEVVEQPHRKVSKTEEKEIVSKPEEVISKKEEAPVEVGEEQAVIGTEENKEVPEVIEVPTEETPPAEISQVEEVLQENVSEEAPVEQPQIEESSAEVDTGTNVISEEVIQIKEDLEEPQIVEEQIQQPAGEQQQILQEMEVTQFQEGEQPHGSEVAEEFQPSAPSQQEPVLMEEESAGAEESTPVKEEQEVAPRPVSTGIPPDYTGPRYRVFISNVTGEEKKEQAAQLVAELTGISYEEALEKFKKVIVPVFQEATEEQANNAIARFKEIKVRATKTKIKS